MLSCRNESKGSGWEGEEERDELRGVDGVSSYEAESTVQAKFFHSTEHKTDDSVNYKALRNMAKDCQ